ncbi:MAG: hypothetical protein ACREX5_12620 [Achromobacter pestifer]
MVEIDIFNMVHMIGSVDKQELIRRAIGM